MYWLWFPRNQLSAQMKPIGPIGFQFELAELECQTHLMGHFGHGSPDAGQKLHTTDRWNVCSQSFHLQGEGLKPVSRNLTMAQPQAKLSGLLSQWFTC